MHIARFVGLPDLLLQLLQQPFVGLCQQQLFLHVDIPPVGLVCLVDRFAPPEALIFGRHVHPDPGHGIAGGDPAACIKGLLQ